MRTRGGWCVTTHNRDPRYRHRHVGRENCDASGRRASLDPGKQQAVEHGNPTRVRQLGAARALYRSADLSALDPGAAINLQEGLKLKVAIDLRSREEWQCAGPPMALAVGGVDCAWCPLPGLGREERKTECGLVCSWAERRLEYMRCHGGALRAAIALLAELGPEATIIGCRAGRDRTGLLAALILGLLGEDSRVIAEDYARTALPADAVLLRYADSRRAECLTRDACESAFRPSAPAMAALCARIAAEYGDWANYASSIGVTPQEMRSLRRARAPDKDRCRADRRHWTSQRTDGGCAATGASGYDPRRQCARGRGAICLIAAPRASFLHDPPIPQLDDPVPVRRVRLGMRHLDDGRPSPLSCVKSSMISRP